MDCNEFFRFEKATASLDATRQLFEYVFCVKQPLPGPCFIFEHFSNEQDFFPCGGYPRVPTTQWQPGSYVHRTRQFIPEGEYDWWIGMTCDTSGERVRIEGTDDNRVPLGRVRVGPLSISAASKAVRAERTVLPELHRHRIRVYASAQGDLVANAERGDHPNRVAVISMPKAGTYLVAKLLAECGYPSCGLLLSHSHFDDYRDSTILDHENVRHFIRSYNTTQLVSPGQSIVGHIKHCLEARVALDRFKRLFLYRNLRDAVVSNARFQIRLGHEVAPDEACARSPLEPHNFAKILAQTGPGLRERFAAVLPWRDEPEVLPVQFEQLLGDRGPARQHQSAAAIARHLGIDLDKRQIAGLLTKVIGHETMTYSGQRSDWRRSWNEDVERTFADTGLKELNRQLGYEKTKWHRPVLSPSAVGRRFAKFIGSRS